jgi:hypothetical protein
MPRGNQHWIEGLDFAIEEWTIDGVRLVEVLGRVHLLEMAHQALSRQKRCVRPDASRYAAVLRSYVNGFQNRFDGLIHPLIRRDEGAAQG